MNSGRILRGRFGFEVRWKKILLLMMLHCNESKFGLKCGYTLEWKRADLGKTKTAFVKTMQCNVRIRRINLLERENADRRGRKEEKEETVPPS